MKKKKQETEEEKTTEEKPEGKNKVIVYSTPTCSYCYKAKDFLKEKKVEFEDIDVSANQEKAKEMIEKSGQMGVPVIEIDGKMIVGFDQDAIEAELEKKR